MKKLFILFISSLLVLSLFPLRLFAADPTYLYDYSLVRCNANSFSLKSLPDYVISNPANQNTFGSYVRLNLKNGYRYTLNIRFDFSDDFVIKQNYIDQGLRYLLFIPQQLNLGDSLSFIDCNTLNSSGMNYIDVADFSSNVDDRFLEYTIQFSVGSGDIDNLSDGIYSIVSILDTNYKNQTYISIATMSIDVSAEREYFGQNPVPIDTSYLCQAYPHNRNGTAYIDYVDNTIITPGSSLTFGSEDFLLFYSQFDFKKGRTYQIKWDLDISGFDDADLARLSTYSQYKDAILENLDGVFVEDGNLSLYSFKHPPSTSDTTLVGSLDYDIETYILRRIDFKNNILSFTFEFSTSPGYIDFLVNGTYGLAISFKCTDMDFSVNDIYCTIEDVTDEEAKIFQQLTVQYIQNVAQNQQTIINYGSGSTVPQGGDKLASTQTKLENAEKAVNDRRVQLQTAGEVIMQTAIQQSSSLTSSIGNSTVMLTGTFTDLWERLPTAVTSALLTCAAIIFAGWLLGRVK